MKDKLSKPEEFKLNADAVSNVSPDDNISEVDNSYEFIKKMFEGESGEKLRKKYAKQMKELEKFAKVNVQALSVRLTG